MAYNVVFEHTRAAGGYEGVRTWTSFKDEEGFWGWYTPQLQETNRVFASGVTKAEAVKLVSQTPVACYQAAALQEATDSQTGRIDPFVLAMEMTNIALLVQLDERDKREGQH